VEKEALEVLENKASAKLVFLLFSCYNVLVTVLPDGATTSVRSQATFSRGDTMFFSGTVFAPFFRGTSIVGVTTDERSVQLHPTDYHQVVLDTTWMEEVDRGRPINGHDCRSIILEQKQHVSLHVGHALHLLARPETIPASWGNQGCILFLGVVFHLQDGTQVVPGFRRFTGDKTWWLHWENLAERAAAYKVAVVSTTPK
jgi:hypothetical protein